MSQLGALLNTAATQNLRTRGQVLHSRFCRAQSCGNAGLDPCSLWGQRTERSYCLFNMSHGICIS